MSQAVRTIPQRRGLTLFEILLVVAIIILVAALSVPTLQRSFMGQKVQSAAERVRAECGRARAAAIRTGEVYAFYYAPEASHFAVAPFKDAAKYVSPDEGISEEEQRFSDLDLSKNLLPRNVVFIEGSVVQETRTQIQKEIDDGEVGGMIPILFYPDGQCQTADIFVANRETGDIKKIKIRGLTGTTTIVDVDQDE